MRLIAVYARRHEPQWLVDDMRANLEPWVDGFAEVDDRGRDPAEAWGHEGQMRTRQRQAAIDAGADWVLVVDPDERIEDRARTALRPLLGRMRPHLIRLPLRELFTPDAYRVDGEWGRYRRTRLYPLLDGQVMSDKPIHAPAVPVRSGLPRIDIDVNLYHLKMVEPCNRPARANAYASAEALHGVGGRRWTRLTRTSGMRLAPVTPGRRFTPGYHRPYVIGAPG